MGTPAAEAQQDEELTVPIKSLNSVRSGSEELRLKKEDDKKNVIDKPEELFPSADKQAQPAGSPTKSILLTPGTGVARRKTVSFGDGVVDNEQKRPALKMAGSKKDAPQGTVSQQWTANLADGTRRNRSKFTQALLDAREKKTERTEKTEKTIEDSDLFDIGDKKSDTAPEKGKPTNLAEPAKGVTEKAMNDGHDDMVTDKQNEDVTTNLEEPRSQSGKYWKSEFENYRAKTNQEIKKLIQYRSVAKSYAKKKEAEAIRLTEKLKREEQRIDDMERHVSKLASDMANDQDSSKEDMVRELSKQTALVLQYKQKAESLRKTMERRGVFEDDVEKNETDSDGVARELRETEEALERANARLEAGGRVPDMSEMQHLVETSEAKAKDVENENSALKRSLARAKDEMSKYEERRKAKEDRLKQREQKLESRLQEYATLLKEAAKRHETAEEEMKNSFAAEKKQLQETIATLKEKLQSSKRASHEGHTPDEDYSKRSARPKDGQDRHSIGGDNIRAGLITKERDNIRSTPSLFDRDDDDTNAETDHGYHLPSPRHSNGQKYCTANFTSNHVSEIDFEEPLITFDGSTPKEPRTRVNARQADDDDIPPSSPPQLPDLESSIGISPNVPKHLSRGTVAAPSPRPSMIYMGEGHNGRWSTDPARRPAVTSAAAAADGDGGLPERSKTSRVATATSSRPNRQMPLHANDENVAPSSDSARCDAGAKRDAIPPDRLAAAKARLKQKQEGGRNTKVDEKENLEN